MSRDVEVPVGVSDNVAAQGEHLPECEDFNKDARVWCICDRLRACEARVFADRTDHWNAGLDAATEAVAALPYDFPLDDDHRGRIHKAAALAAIAALKATP